MCFHTLGVCVCVCVCVYCVVCLRADDPVGAPMSLLPHIDWCVTEAPEDARLVNDDTHNSGDDHMSVGSISGSESVCDGDREYGGEGDDGNVCVGIHMDTDWMDEPLWKVSAR